MDERERRFDPFDGTFNETTMTGLLWGEGPPIKCHWEMCDLCEGKGTHVSPSVDSHGISAEEFYDDPDFAESYFSGVYDVPCAECGGRRVMWVPNTNDPNIKEYEEAVQSHYDYLGEMEAERRMGA